MTTGIAERAAESVGTNEVQQIIERLSHFGLGVCAPHMHDPLTNEMIPLPPNMVQSESNLKVSFVERDQVDAQQVAVAWFWDDGLKTVQSCAMCLPPDGPHH